MTREKNPEFCRFRAVVFPPLVVEKQVFPLKKRSLSRIFQGQNHLDVGDLEKSSVILRCEIAEEKKRLASVFTLSAFTSRIA